MPGQRLASLKLRIIGGGINPPLRIWLNGRYEEFFLGVQSDAQVRAQTLVNNIAARLQANGHAADYTLSLSAAPVSPPEVVLTATAYYNAFNFQPCTGAAVGFVVTEVERLDGIKPVFIMPSVNAAICFGSSTGAITLTVSNYTLEPSGPYTYLWDDGVTTQNRSNLPAGSYLVTVTDASGAYAVATIAVGQGTAITVNIGRTGADLTTTVAGGVAPYTYQWADGPTTPGRTGVVAGVTYAVVVTDAHGCSKAASLRFELLRYWFSGNPIPLTLDAGDAYRADPTTKPELRFGCEVWVEPDYLSGDFVRVGPVLEQPADATGRTTFEVQELLEPYVAHHLPAPNQPYVSPATGLFRRFFLRHYEITTAGPGVAVTLDDNYLVRGGLGFVEASAGSRWFDRYQPDVLPFLTWEPTTKKVLPDQPEYLYCMVPRAEMTELRYRLRLFFSDGSTADVLHTLLSDVRRFEVYCLPAGFQQLMLADYESPALQVRRWEVAVLDQDEVPASETRTYQLDRRPAPQRRYFHYANSLGGLNTLCDRGRGLRTLATSTLQTETQLAAGYDAVEGDVRIDRKTGQPTLKCSAGVREPDQQQADQDFALSERVLLLDGGQYVPGTVKDRTFTAADGNETRRLLEFDFELPKERFYTPTLRS